MLPTYSDDQQDLITLCVLRRMLSILHGLIQYIGEVGWTVKLHLAKSVVVSIQYPLYKQHMGIHDLVRCKTKCVTLKLTIISEIERRIKNWSAIH